MPLARIRLRVILPVALILLSGAAHADCTALREQAGTAQKAGDSTALMALFEQAAVEPSCDDAYRQWLGRTVARGVERAVHQGLSTGKPLAPFEADLTKSLRYARSWRSLTWLGDIARERKDHAVAARQYQDALAAIEDEVATPQAPEPATIAAIFAQAEQERLLAETHVAAPTTRAGAPGGLAATRIRGFVPTKVALPIEFRYDSVEFTPKGAAAAAELLSMLKAQPPGGLTLVGHTDSRGGRDYNMALSRRRAEAVRGFLVDGGYAGAVQVDGQGPGEPMKLDDPRRYSAEELHQLNRRVELRR